MRLVLYQIKIRFKQAMVDRVSFVNNLWIQFYAYMVTLLNLLLLLQAVGVVGGWNFNELLLLWAVNVFTYGISGIVIHAGCGNLERSVQNGEFDLVLTKPTGVFRYYMHSHINVTFIFHIVFSLALLTYTFIANHVVLTCGRLLYIFVLLFSAVVLQSCIMILLASTSFWIIKSSDIVNTAIYGLRGLCNYPITIYSAVLQFILLFIVPYAFISYVPATFILSKDISFLGQILIYIQPIFVALIALCTKFVWDKGVRNYSSTGH